MTLGFGGRHRGRRRRRLDADPHRRQAEPGRVDHDEARRERGGDLPCGAGSIPELTTTLGAGTALTVVFDQAPFVERSIHDLTTEGLLGLTFAVIIILIFLLSIRSTLVTAVSIPLSVVIALIALWVGDYSLNILTLGAMTIAVGRVVDDSIVVLENIKRHLGYGEPKRQAILSAVGEVSGAVTASTLTTVAVFLPIAFVGGIGGPAVLAVRGDGHGGAAGLAAGVADGDPGAGLLVPEGAGAVAGGGAAGA